MSMRIFFFNRLHEIASAALVQRKLPIVKRHLLLLVEVIRMNIV